MKNLPEELKIKIRSAFPRDILLIESIESTSNMLPVLLSKKAIFMKETEVLKKLAPLKEDVFNPVFLARFLHEDATLADLKELIGNIQNALLESGLKEVFKSAEEVIIAEKLLKEINPYVY